MNERCLWGFGTVGTNDNRPEVCLAKTTHTYEVRYNHRTYFVEVTFITNLHGATNVSVFYDDVRIEDHYKVYKILDTLENSGENWEGLKC